MSDDDGKESPDQQAWLKLVRAMREQLAKRIADVPTMCPADMKLFIEAITEARWPNERTLYMDENIERERNKLPFQD